MSGGKPVTRPVRRVLYSYDRTWAYSLSGRTNMSSSCEPKSGYINQSWAITSGIGGENITENIEGRDRYPILIRYALDFRDDIQKLERVVIATPSNAQVPLGGLAKISFSKGHAMIRDEDGALTGYVYLDLNTRDYSGSEYPLPDEISNDWKTATHAARVKCTARIIAINRTIDSGSIRFFGPRQKLAEWIRAHN
jgi:hypothetical protein